MKPIQGHHRFGVQVGTFSVRIEVGDPSRTRFEAMEALVDTGSTFLVARPILEALGIAEEEHKPFSFADGRTQEYAMGAVSLRLEGRTLPTLCVFGDPRYEPLLGAVALETFLLAPDAVHQQLVPVNGLLMRRAP